MTVGVDIDVVVHAQRWLDQLPDAEDICRTAALAAVRVVALAAGAADGASAAGCNLTGAEACIVLTDDAEIRSLNHAYRGQDKATNVLAFAVRDAPLPDVPGPDGGSLGDVVIAFETAAGEAADDGTPLNWHLSHLVVHGILHLLGFDHQDEGEADEMEGLEIRILAMLGVDDPYTRAENAEPDITA